MPTLLADPPVDLSGPARLARAKPEYLPIDGPGSPQLRIQGRMAPSDDGLADLKSSIATIGVMQQILVERLPDNTLWVVAGQRRLLAARQLLAEQPDVATLSQGIRSLVCPGPLTETERRFWSLVENLSRIDLSPTELGRDLLFARAALLAERLTQNGYTVPVEIIGAADPVARFRDLDAFRVEQGALHIGAPWDDVVTQIGMEISESRAQQIVRAVTAIPPDLAAEMDAAGISVSTRLAWIKLAKKDPDLARKVWEEAGRDPDTFRPAVRAANDDLGSAQARVPASLPAAVGQQTALAMGGGSDPDFDEEPPELAAPDFHAGRASAEERPAEVTRARGPDAPATILDAGPLLHEIREARKALAGGARLSSSQEAELRAEFGLLFDVID